MPILRYAAAATRAHRLGRQLPYVHWDVARSGNQLEPVPLRLEVGSGHDHDTAQPADACGQLGGGRGHRAEVDDVHARLARERDHRRGEVAALRSPVAGDAQAPGEPTLVQQGDQAADRATDDGRRQVDVRPATESRMRCDHRVRPGPHARML